MAETTTDQKATDAAQRRADEAGLDLAGVEGTGSGGQVTAQDVERAIQAEEAEEAAARLAGGEAARGEAETLVVLKLKPALAREGTTSVEVGDRTFRAGDRVSRAEFDRLLKPAKDTEGRQALHIDKEVK